MASNISVGISRVGKTGSGVLGGSVEGEVGSCIAGVPEGFSVSIGALLQPMAIEKTMKKRKNNWVFMVQSPVKIELITGSIVQQTACTPRKFLKKVKV